jgi:prepilin-type N-terminal cleavage/methylation domain-containing protein
MCAQCRTAGFSRITQVVKHQANGDRADFKVGDLQVARSPNADVQGQRGLTLVEVMIALVVMALGILAIAQLFPASTRSQSQSSMLTAASFYAEQKLEALTTTPWDDVTLSVGRHPSATSAETLGTTGAWSRFYDVDTLPAAAMNNMKRVVVTVQWSNGGARALQDTVYLRK